MLLLHMPPLRYLANGGLCHYTQGALQLPHLKVLMVLDSVDDRLPLNSTYNQDFCEYTRMLRESRSLCMYMSGNNLVLFTTKNITFYILTIPFPSPFKMICA